MRWLRVCRAISIGIFLAWAAGLGYLAYLICNHKLLCHPESPIEQTSLGFVLTAVLFGALGGVVRAIVDFRGYISRIDLEIPRYVDAKVVQAVSEDQEGRETTVVTRERRHPETNHCHFLFFKPLVWPIPAGAFGLMLAIIFFDSGASFLRVALVAFTGGLFVGPLVEKLGAMFGLTEQS